MTTPKKPSIQELLENARLLGYEKIYPKNKLPVKPVDIGDLCIDCYAKGIHKDTTKQGFVNRIPAETDEYSGYMCGPCAEESSDYIDKMKAEEDLFTILKDALDRSKDSILTHPCDVDQIENVCRFYGYESLLE